MKPTTTQQFAQCYGTFMSDLQLAAAKIPALNSWLQTSLPDVSTKYKLDPSAFNAYPATIPNFPSAPNNRSKDFSGPGEAQYSKAVSLDWTAMTIDLKAALTCAEVNPTEAASIIAAFNNCRPRTSK